MLVSSAAIAVYAASTAVLRKGESGLVLTKLQKRSLVSLAQVAKAVNLTEGDQLEIILEQDGSIRLVPVFVIPKSQAYYWSKEWQQAEREADEDFSAGRYEDFASTDALITDLKTRAGVREHGRTS